MRHTQQPYCFLVDAQQRASLLGLKQTVSSLALLES